MRKMILGFGLIIFLTIFPIACGMEEEFCRDMARDYLVNKTVTSLHCQQNGKKVKIDNPDEVLPLFTALQISQGGCSIWANENVWRNDTFIPYGGSIDEDDDFSLEIRNPENVSIPMNFEIGGKKVKCLFNGGIQWEGEAKSDDHLTGEIYYDLKKRHNARKSCPDACSINMTFDADKAPQ